jgi:flagellar biosynthesis/type III secretory pathway chaperone
MADLFEKHGVAPPKKPTQPDSGGTDLFAKHGVEPPSAGSERGGFTNAISMANDRFTDLGGNFVQGVGSLMRYGGQAVDAGFDAAGIPLPSNEDIGMMAPSEALTQVGDKISGYDFGFEPTFTVDRAIEDPSLTNIAGAIGENAPAAVADMVGLAANPAGYFLTRNQEIAEERAGNNRREGDQPTAGEFGAAAPGTLGSILLDRAAFLRNIGGGPVNNMTDVAKETGKGLVREGGTEGVQEGGLEYGGASVGTEKGWQPGEAGKRTVGGVMIGGPVGGGLSGIAARLRMTPEEVVAEAERLGITPEEVEQSYYNDGPGKTSLDEKIATAAGTDRPEPPDMGKKENREARAKEEASLADALNNQTDILRRDDIEYFEDDGTPVLKDGARPAQDPRGRQANIDTLGAQRQADQIARDLGVTLPGDRLGLAARDIANGLDPREAVRSYAPEVQGNDIKVAEARRRRRDEKIAGKGKPERTPDGAERGGFNQGRDYRAGTSDRPQNQEDQVLILDAKFDRQGKLVAGEQVKSTGDLVQDEQGNQHIQIETMDGRTMLVPASRVTARSQPQNPRMEQEFEDSSMQAQDGVNTSMPGARQSTDRISTRQVTDPNAGREVEPGIEDVIPNPNPAPGGKGPNPNQENDPRQASNERESRTYNQNRPPERRGFDEVNRPPEPEGLGRALNNPMRNRLPGPDTETRTTGEVTGEVEANASQQTQPDAEPEADVSQNEQPSNPNVAKVNAIADQWENEIGDKGMADAVRNGAKLGNGPDDANVQFQQKKLDEARAEKDGTAAPEQDSWTVEGTAATTDREKKDYAEAKEQPELADTYQQAEDVASDVVQYLNDQGYSMERKEKMPAELRKMANDLTGLAGTMNRLSKQGVAVPRGYRRANPQQRDKTAEAAQKTISELREQLPQSNVGNADQQQETDRAPEATPETEAETEAAQTAAEPDGPVNEEPPLPKPAGPNSKEIDVNNDSLLDAIGREGGMNWEEGLRLGLDAADMKLANRERPARQPFRKTTDRTSAKTAESMTEQGYLKEDRDDRELADRLSDEFRGEPVWSTRGDAAEKVALHEEWQQNEDYLEQERMERESSANQAEADQEFDLEEQTEESTRQRETDEELGRQADEAAAREEEQRAEADAQRDDFTLTGSDRQVDEAEARGQSNLFDDPNVEPNGTDPDAVPDGNTENLGGTTMLSGVPTWDMIKKFFGPMFMGSKAELDAWTTNAKDMIDDFRDAAKEKTSNASTAFRRFYNATIGDLDGATRALADRYDSPTLKAVADAFHHQAGGKSDGFTQQTLSARRNKWVNKFNSRFEAISKKLKAQKVRRRDRDAQSMIYDMLENPNKPRKGPIGEAVTEIEKLFKDLREYQLERGIDVGYVEGYVPRWLDRTLVGKSKTAFVNRATEAYQQMGSDRETARAQAAALYDAVMDGDKATLGQNKAGTTAGVDSTKPRKLSKEAAKKLDAFWQRDIDQAVSSYIHAAISRGEVADTEIAGTKLGDNAENWTDIRAKMQEEDPSITGDDLEAIETDVAFHTGLAQSSDSRKARIASSTVRTLGSMMLLDRVAITGMVELAMPAMRATTGNPLQDLGTQADNAVTVINSTIKKLLRTISGGAVGKDQALNDLYDMAEYLGATAGDAISYSMQARMMGEETTGRAMTQMADKYYRNIGLTQLNDFTRVISIKQANRFMAYLARDHQRGGRSKNRTEVQLRDLGVPRGQEKEFADWYGKHFAKTPPTASKLEALRQKGGQDKKMADAYDRAVHTFVDQAIQRPDSSTRPRWADGPLGAMVFQLLSFQWAFQKNVLGRAGRTAMNEELSYTDRALMSAGFMSGGLALTALAAIGNTTRDELDDKTADLVNGRPPTPETDWRKAEKAVSYAGFTGRLDPWLQLYSGLRYQRSAIESVSGPTVGTVGTFIDRMIGLNTTNSDNTNTAERQAMKSLHQVIITPAMQAALTSAPLFGPAGRALVMGASVAGVRATREPFIRATAGEEDRKLQQRRVNNPLKGMTEPEGSGGSGGYGRGRERAASRGGSRGGSREAGR